MMTPEARVNLLRAEDESERKAISDVRDYGVHILHIFDPDGASPGFSYTVGLWHTHGHPEVLIFGLADDLCHGILNQLNREIEEGKSFRANCSSMGLLEGFRVYFENLPAERFGEFLGWDRWFYGGGEFEAVQMIWPNTSGVFPWESRANEELRWLEPIYTERPCIVS